MQINFDIQQYIIPFITDQDVAPNSRTTYQNALHQFSFWIVNNNITKLTRDIILRYKFWLDTRSLSSFTKAIYLVVIKKFFQWTEEQNLYKNIAHGIKSAKRSTRNHQKDSLSAEGVKKVLHCIDRGSLQGKRDYALINMLIRTGLRLREIASASINDMQQEGDSTLLWIRGKGRHGKDEFVMLTQETLNSLHDYLLCRKIESEQEPLFASVSDRNFGKLLTTFSLSRIIRNRLIASGLKTKRITAHSLRHTFGVLAMKAGASLYEVQLAMRHAAPTTTQLYLGDIERLKRLEAAPEKKISALLQEQGL